MTRRSKKLTVAIIIPVYNEEHRIAACLSAIAAQTDKPDEVIVVNNNSSDKTVSIARQFDFVRIVQEQKQGTVFARNKGFNLARSDILGRIDADSQIAPTWVATVKRQFGEDPETAGITGPGWSLLLPRIRWPRTLLWSRLYFLWTEIFYRVPVMWGANMALRRSAWQTIRTHTSLDGVTMHEDHDLSIVLQAYAGRVRYCSDLRFISFSQAYHYFPKLLRYIRMRHTGRRYHRNNGDVKKLKPTLSRGQSACIYAFAWPLIVLFLGASLLMWPLDALMFRLKGRTWLS